VSVLGEIRDTLRPGADSRHGPLVPLMVTLTLVTGVVDATSYLELGHVFVANMTGNVVFIGFALAGASGLSAWTSLVALASFILGASAGARLSSLNSDHRGRLLRSTVAVQIALMMLALIISLLTREPPSSSVRYALVVPLAIAMGMQNAAATSLSVPELTTTVLTKTLTGIASEVGGVGGHGSKLGRRVVSVGAMLLGALAGGLLVLHVAVAAALALACVLVLAVALVAHRLSSSQEPWSRP
jgi:uncharacterized membrane protein YoaK (UPF0700 family)